jgi:hypothetical protein
LHRRRETAQHKQRQACAQNEFQGGKSNASWHVIHYHSLPMIPAGCSFLIQARISFFLLFPSEYCLGRVDEAFRCLIMFPEICFVEVFPSSSLGMFCLPFTTLPWTPTVLPRPGIFHRLSTQDLQSLEEFWRQDLGYEGCFLHHQIHRLPCILCEGAVTSGFPGDVAGRAILLHVLHDRSLSLAQPWDGGDDCFLPPHGRQAAGGVDDGVVHVDGGIASIAVGRLVSMAPAPHRKLRMRPFASYLALRPSLFAARASRPGRRCTQTRWVELGSHATFPCALRAGGHTRETEGRRGKESLTDMDISQDFMGKCAAS